jgi:hypothetical protein
MAGRSGALTFWGHDRLPNNAEGGPTQARLWQAFSETRDDGVLGCPRPLWIGSDQTGERMSLTEGLTGRRAGTRSLIGV